MVIHRYSIELIEYVRMSLYTLSSSRLQEIKPKPFKLEKEIQSLEDNLSTLFGLDFICTEFPQDSLRIDTLAFDHERKAFEINEYMRDENINVIVQGFTPLGRMPEYCGICLRRVLEKKISSYV
ncbi:hypothetical protein O3Q51_17055 [Cryomorphaceae bacterium 1068]|nr:hypothetical protein [Cryomorphaceae bacterium 1068]